jgi:para-aminobenzoate synthetase component 1
MSTELAYATCAQPVAADWLPLVAGLAERRGFWWLDSALAQPPLGRFSFAGAEPWCVLRVRSDGIACELRRAPWKLAPLPERGDALAALRALLPAPGASIVCASEERAALPFVGGLVTALGYELGARFEGVAAPDDATPLPFADATAFGVDRLFAFDHLEGRAFAVALCAGATERAAADAARRAASALAVNAPRGAWPPPSGRDERAGSAP